MSFTRYIFAWSAAAANRGGRSKRQRYLVQEKYAVSRQAWQAVQLLKQEVNQRTMRNSVRFSNAQFVVAGLQIQLFLINLTLIQESNIYLQYLGFNTVEKETRYQLNSFGWNSSRS
jgi:ATP-dependent phosphoenolpyruvate carboxykinase